MMSRNLTTNLIRRTGEIAALISLPRSAWWLELKPHVAVLRISLTCTAMALERICPVVWAVMPDKAMLLVCLSSGCSALANWLV